jgi:multidrug efflux pump subunit AcrA (membrane-fusion protein)
MNDARRSQVSQLRIDPSAKRRSQGTLWTIFGVVSVVAVVAVGLWRPWEPETSRVLKSDGSTSARSEAANGGAKATPTTQAPTAARSGSNTAVSSSTTASQTAKAPPADGVVLTVSGYIINRERIELSPRFMGQVRWIGVKKGDPVTNGQVVVLLDDAEYQAQKQELSGRLESAKVQVRRSELELNRTLQLADARIESQRMLDLAP